MRIVDIIIKKRDGGKLTAAEIDYFVTGYTEGSISDEQASALLMAIFFRGMDAEETTELTLSMARSGGMLDLSAVPGIKVDKHSTGGIGDKTSLIVCPIASAAGVPIVKMSGRALGFTGGTIDKLESIPGFRTSLSLEEMLNVAAKTGLVIAGQTAELAPADKKLYALRDVTGTVDSIPLIAASIMSKKIAAGGNAIVLDVKYGSGAFMKTKESAQALADCMCAIGNGAGRKTVAVLNSMEQPLGKCVGNFNEVIEAIDALKGSWEPDLEEHCIHLAGNMIALGLNIPLEEAIERARATVADGSALDKLRQMIAGQGGDASVLDDPYKVLGRPKYSLKVKSETAGNIVKVDALLMGKSVFALGAGRAVKTDPADPHAGAVLAVKSGKVRKGTLLCTLYSDKPITDEAISLCREAFEYGKE